MRVTIRCCSIWEAFVEWHTTASTYKLKSASLRIIALVHTFISVVSLLFILAKKSLSTIFPSYFMIKITKTNKCKGNDKGNNKKRKRKLLQNKWRDLMMKGTHKHMAAYLKLLLSNDQERYLWSSNISIKLFCDFHHEI